MFLPFNGNMINRESRKYLGLRGKSTDDPDAVSDLLWDPEAA